MNVVGLTILFIFIRNFNTHFLDILWFYLLQGCSPPSICSCSCSSPKFKNHCVPPVKRLPTPDLLLWFFTPKNLASIITELLTFTTSPLHHILSQWPFSRTLPTQPRPLQSQWMPASATSCLPSLGRIQDATAVVSPPLNKCGLIGHH